MSYYDRFGSERVIGLSSLQGSRALRHLVPIGCREQAMMGIAGGDVWRSGEGAQFLFLSASTFDICLFVSQNDQMGHIVAFGPEREILASSPPSPSSPREMVPDVLLKVYLTRLETRSFCSPVGRRAASTFHALNSRGSCITASQDYQSNDNPAHGYQGPRGR